MTRLFYVLGLSFALAVAPLWAETAAKSSPGNACVQHVAVRETDGATEVEIKLSGTGVAPTTQVLSGPDRIIVDFPGALLADELHALAMKVDAGALKGVRAGLFFNNPPIARIVLDLSAAQSYHISNSHDGVVVTLGADEEEAAKLSPAQANSAKSGTPKLSPARHETGSALSPNSANVSVVRIPRLQNAVFGEQTRVTRAEVSIPVVTPDPPPPPKPPVTVTFENGLLRIRSEKATLAQVLYEVQAQTQAEIAIPAGAETEQVIADVGPAPAREVLASLLNGSPYNFIFVGDEQNLERVILTRRDPNIF